MIHTFTIYFPLNRQSAGYCVTNLNRIAREYAPQNGRVRYHSDAVVREYLDGDLNTLNYSMEFLYLGLHQIKFTKKRMTDRYTSYYIYFRIEPEVFISRQYSLNLFQCNENNYDALQSRFGEVAYRLFPRAIEHRPIEESIIDCLTAEERRYLRRLEEGYYLQQLDREELELYRMRHLFSLLYLGLAKISRVDYTADFYCDHPGLYMELAQKSYVDNKTKKRKVHLEKGTSLAAYYKNVDGFLIYNKQKKYMLADYDDKPNIDELRQAAANIMRVEYVFESRDRRTQLKFTKLCLPRRGAVTYVSTYSLCGMMPYIIQDLGASRLRDNYYAHIGGGQWMSDYHWYDCTLAKSDLTEKMKRRLYKLAYLISEVRHLGRSKDAFIQGRDIQRYRGSGSLHIQGNGNTFDRYVKKIRSLGLQPLRIPDNRGVTHVSSEYDDFTFVDLGVENHVIADWLPERDEDYPNYASMVADLKALYNQRKPVR